MSLIATVGIFAALLPGPLLKRLLKPLLALASGSLLGSAFFHMLPEGSASLDPLVAAGWVVAGFTAFLVIEQWLRWHRNRPEVSNGRAPFTYLILVGDGIHNFLGGLSVASTFLISPHAGISAWIAAAVHEVPQELGDFGVLVHGGWPKRLALVWNFLTALTFPLGGLIAYFAAQHLHVAPLVLFGGGSFIYIAACDLIPEMKHEASLLRGLELIAVFIAGLILTFIAAGLHVHH